MQIYLSGAVTDWDNPFEWHDEVADEWDEHEFVNPYKLNDFELGDDDVYKRPHEVVEPALAAVQESDGMLVNWDDDAFLVGTAIEMWTAHREGIPIVIWYDGYRENLSPWLLYMSAGDWEERDKCIRVLLALAGDTEAIHK